MKWMEFGTLEFNAFNISDKVNVNYTKQIYLYHKFTIKGL
jgi:hypothetical protein